MPGAPTASAPALAAFDAADVPVAAALAHLHAPLDRPRLLALRQARRVESVREAQRLLEPFPSALLHVAFVAEPYAALGAHAEALAAFLEALPETPRWDSALTARVLGGTADALSALGRGEEAVVASARALRFMPAEPRLVAAHGRALAAAGRWEDAAAHRAWLHDLGVGKAILPEEASELEAVDAAVPDLTALEPLDAEGMARHLVFAFADLGLANHMLQGRRHAMACLRHGVVHAALTTLDGYAGGTPNAVEAGRWLGWPVGGSDLLATDALLALVSTAAKAVRSDKAAKDLRHKQPGARIAAVERLVGEGQTAVAREALFDRVAAVRLRAAQLLGDDPVVLRMRAVEADLDPALRFLEGTVVAGASHHGATSLTWQGKAIAYPPSEPVGPPDLHAPHLEPAPDGRSKCKLCKAPIAAGELRLRVRHKFFPVETFYTHLACAAGGKHGPLQASTQLERGDGPLLLVALRRSRRRFPERDALLAQLTSPR